VRPDAGEVLIDGYDVRSAGGQVRESIGLVLVNERSLYWRVDAIENLAVFGRLRGLPASTVRLRTASLLEELEMQHLAHERVGRLSTGQRQRLMVARALLADAPVLLVDEPLRGLDEQGVRVVLDLLARRARDGAAVLIAAPLIEDLMVLAHGHARLIDGLLSPGVDLPAPIEVTST
jgi:ABC-2 type transport system ATP-binding protein